VDVGAERAHRRVLLGVVADRDGDVHGTPSRWQAIAIDCP
jgi:hypothetical protein